MAEGFSTPRAVGLTAPSSPPALLVVAVRLAAASAGFARRGAVRVRSYPDPELWSWLNSNAGAASVIVALLTAAIAITALVLSVKTTFRSLALAEVSARAEVGAVLVVTEMAGPGGFQGGGTGGRIFFRVHNIGRGPAQELHPRFHAHSGAIAHEPLRLLRGRESIGPTGPTPAVNRWEIGFEVGPRDVVLTPDGWRVPGTVIIEYSDAVGPHEARHAVPLRPATGWEGD